MSGLEITSMGAIATGTLASLIAGLGTGLGALPAFFIRSLSIRLETIMLSLAGGVMLAAAVFSLLLPALDSAEPLAGGSTLASVLAVFGMAVGIGLFWLLHGLLPHEHAHKGREGPDQLHIKRLWLFILAITLHNFPEGLAVGVGANQEDQALGLALTLGILLQNLPEGLIVALSFLSLGRDRAVAVGLATLTGLVEPVGGFVGAVAVSLAEIALPIALAAAAGAMLWVVGGEVIPETHRRGHENRATFGLIIGFAAMVVLNGALAA